MAEPFASDLRDRILTQLYVRRAAGESFDAIAATPGWPSRPTLRKWIRQEGLPPPPAIRARPVRWSRKLANRICARHAFESLREICRDPAMPDRKTLDQWMRKRPWFAAALAQARRDADQPPTGRRS